MKTMKAVFLALSVVLALGAPAFAATPCTCDLNRDTRCDMRDWLLFGQRWGAINCASVPCACDLNADGRCDMRDWLLFGRDWGRTDCLVFTDGVIEGAWISVFENDPVFAERPYVIFDGNGHIIDFGAFELDAQDPGTYSVEPDGAVSMTFNFIDIGAVDVTGNLVSDTEMVLGDESSSQTWVKVPDRAYLSGVWEGVLLDSDQIHQYPVLFVTDATGSVIYFEGFESPVSGRMLGTGTFMSSFFRTGDAGEFNQFSLIGEQFYHNVITGYYVTDSNPEVDGTFQLYRDGMWIDGTHYIEVDIDVFCSNGSYYIHCFVADADHCLTGAYVEGPYGRLDLVYGAYPDHAEFWTNPPSQSIEVPGVFPQTWTAVITTGSGSVEMFDEIKTGCDED